MIGPRTCPECGAALAADAPGGLCPQCLWDLGTAEATVTPAPSVAGPARPQARAFGNYELLEEIAHGGMGVVYRARQLNLNREVAVKMIRAERLARPEEVRRFHLEAEAAATLQHPHIVAIHEAGEVEGQHFYSMDFVQGRNLAEILREQPLGARRAARYVQAIAEAVHYAHGRGILHRDLKPSNVLIDANDQPRVTDFGLAKVLQSGSDLTLSGQVLGSPSYMAPEQAAGHAREVDARTDVYALGAILYELLSGRPPFKADTSLETLQLVVESEPLSPRLLNPRLPRDLETICLKCLEKEPRRRYATAQELVDDLGRYLSGQPVCARPVGLAGKTWRWCKRKPVVASLATGLALMLVLGFGGVLWQWQRTKAGERVARRNAYAADMNLLQQALKDGDLERALLLLNAHRPAPGQVDLRGWEWRYFWQLCQSDERLTLWQYSNAVSALAYSADGKWLAVRRETGTVALWNTSARQQVAEFAGAGSLKALVFSPRGNLLAWGNSDFTGKVVVSIMDVTTRRTIAQLGHPASVMSVDFSPDAQRLATYSAEGTVRIWDFAAGQVLCSLSAAEAGLRLCGKVLFSPDGQVLAIGETAGKIRLWEWAKNTERVFPLPELGNGVVALAFSPDGQRLAAGYGYWHGKVHVWDLPTGTETQLLGHWSWVSSLAFAADNVTLVSAGADTTIRLWDISRGVELRRFQGNTREVWAAVFSPDGKDLVSGSKDGALRFWDPAAKPRASFYTVLPTSTYLGGFTFLPDSKRLLRVREPDGAVFLSDATTLREGERLSFLGTNNAALALSKDGRLLAVGDWDGQIQVWDLVTRRPVTNLVSTGKVSLWGFLRFTGQGGLLLSGFARPDGSRTVRLWQVATWQELDLRQIDLGDLQWACVAPGERTLAISYADGGVTLWDLVTGQRQADFRGHRRTTESRVAFSPDGRTLVSATADGQAIFWDVAARRSLASVRGNLEALVGVNFSPDGRRLVTGSTSAQDTARLWDPGSMRSVATFAGVSAQCRYVGFSPDGNTLFAVGMTGPVCLWRAPSWEEIEAAEKARAQASRRNPETAKGLPHGSVDSRSSPNRKTRES